LKLVSDVATEEYEGVIIPGDFYRDYLSRDEAKVNLTDYNKYTF